MRANHTLLIFCLLALFAGAALAQGTPDGETPAQEAFCDEQVGAAFGLCNAYCEAMDCHLPIDGDPAPSASQNACDRVGDKFEQLTGGRPPCEGTCPCGGTAEWAGAGNWDLFAAGGQAAGCTDSGSPNLELSDTATEGEGTTIGVNATSCYYESTDVLIDSFILTSAGDAAACYSELRANNTGLCS